MTSQYRLTSTLALGLGLLAAASSANALELTLPTSLLNANAVYSFSSTSATVMGRMGIGVSALGDATSVNGSAWTFNMPVTQVSVDASILPLALTPVSGQAKGAGLLIQDDTGALALSNFGLDFTHDVLTADLTTASGTSKAFDVFSFTVAQGLTISDSNGLSLNMNLTNMTLTSGAQSAFANALNLPSFAVAVLGNLNFGSLAVDISPSLRMGVSGNALVVGAVPEAPSPYMFALGLLGMTVVSRRRTSAQLQNR